MRTVPIGRSEITAFKQEELAKYIPLQIDRIRKTQTSARAKEKKDGGWKKWFLDRDLLFIDATAGDLDKNHLTSPQIFLQEIFAKNIPSQPFLIERGVDSSRKKNNNFERLNQNYEENWKKYCPNNVRVELLKTEFQEFLQEWGVEEEQSIIEYKEEYKGIYGLLYFDPNGFQIEAYKSIFEFCNKFPQVEVLLNINTHMIIKLRPVPQFEQTEYKTTYFSSILRRINKKFIWLRDNESIPCKNPWKFITVYGSNWEKSKPSGPFYPIDSPNGQKIIQKHNFSSKEIKNVA